MVKRLLLRLKGGNQWEAQISAGRGSSFTGKKNGEVLFAMDGFSRQRKKLQGRKNRAFHTMQAPKSSVLMDSKRGAWEKKGRSDPKEKKKSFG